MRINVIGSSGVGKTTFSESPADREGVPYLELDAIHHLADWKPIDTTAIRTEVARFCAAEHWVVDGNYSKVRDVIWERADTVVFLDLSRRNVMRRLIPRTLRRVVTGEELWNGNRERWSNLLSSSPEENIVVWSWTRHELQRRRFDDARTDQRWAHIEFVQLRSVDEMNTFAP